MQNNPYEQNIEIYINLYKDEIYSCVVLEPEAKGVFWCPLKFCMQDGCFTCLTLDWDLEILLNVFSDRFSQNLATKNLLCDYYVPITMLNFLNKMSKNVPNFCSHGAYRTHYANLESIVMLCYGNGY